MTDSTLPVTGSASAQSELWGPGASSWATLQEHTSTPIYEHMLRQLHVGPGARLLDVGCGAGLFCKMAA